MKTFYMNFFAVLLTIFLFSCKEKPKNAEIRINQIGYYPNSVKKAVVVESNEDEFEIKTTDGKEVFEGKLKDAGYWDKSGENVKIADFTAFNKPGKYILSVDDAKSPSYEFEIKTNLYDDAFKASLKSYYLIRVSMDIDEKYAGIYKRKGGHPDTLCYLHPSAERGEGHIASPKGWYDAGDYNKYVVNGGVTVGTLLNLYEMYPEVAADGYTNIPESGNGVSDLLDEIKYELDWVLTMQAPDGASAMKLTSKNFTGFIMPDQDKTKRFVVGKATAPTLNFAAMTAQAARLYKNIDAGFAERCLTAAEKAWSWTEKHPDIEYKNPPDIKTGEYGDNDFTEEFWWAASELYLATGKEQYLEYLNTHEPYIKMVVGETWRQFLGNIGSFSLLLAETQPEITPVKEKIKTQLLETADALLNKIDTIPYRIAIDKFKWGSNSDVQNTAIILAYAYRLTKDKKYLDGVMETMDYIFGKNAVGYTFLTGFGSKRVMHIHNRISGADGIEEPLPGLIAGGPNGAQQDNISKTKFGVEYPSDFPAKSYVDKQPSYASNENAINWNAPNVFVLGFIKENTDKLQ
ncbi:MAG: cellulase [Chlorobi bacterium]|nr:cellulase [Chlorobiota bacterium]